MRTTTKETGSSQPLSAGTYAIIALVGLFFGVGLLFVYIDRVPKLVENRIIQSQIFYLLLIPWGLSCAAFLFGAMRSYARFTHRRLGSALELGGPVVLFGLVLVGGFRLVPQAGEAFSLTVRAHSTDGRDPIISEGALTLEAGSLRRTVSFDSAGEANFKELPSQFRGSIVRILPQVNGYSEQWQTLKITGDVLDLSLSPAPQPEVLLTGSITPPPTSPDVRILVDGQQAEAAPDQFGRFELKVNGKAGDRVRLKVYRGQNLIKDDYYVLPGPAEISLDASPSRAN